MFIDPATNFIASIANTISAMVNSFTAHTLSLLIIIASAFAVYFINLIFFKGRLNRLGLRSRKPKSLIGIVCTPWLHGDFSHLSMNAVFFYILASMTLVIISFHTFIYLSIYLTIFTGLLTWIFARPLNHIGASGVIMGYWGFILVSAIQHPSAFTILTGLICLFYFGTLASNLVPTDPKSSWESHLFGCLCGVSAAFIPLFSA